MKEEIKEMMDKIQKCKDYDDEVLLIKQYGATLLLDYITNLQEENKRLNNIIDELILECYNCDMTFGEFKNIWKKAYNKEYNSKDFDKLKELKGE